MISDISFSWAAPPNPNDSVAPSLTALVGKLSYLPQQSLMLQFDEPIASFNSVKTHHTLPSMGAAFVPGDQSKVTFNYIAKGYFREKAFVTGSVPDLKGNKGVLNSSFDVWDPNAAFLKGLPYYNPTANPFTNHQNAVWDTGHNVGEQWENVGKNFMSHSLALGQSNRLENGNGDLFAKTLRGYKYLINGGDYTTYDWNRDDL